MVRPSCMDGCSHGCIALCLQINMSWHAKDSMIHINKHHLVHNHPLVPRPDVLSSTKDIPEELRAEIEHYVQASLSIRQITSLLSQVSRWIELLQLMVRYDCQKEPPIQMDPKVLQGALSNIRDKHGVFALLQ
jgi:hypothetical protein